MLPQESMPSNILLLLPMSTHLKNFVPVLTPQKLNHHYFELFSALVCNFGCFLKMYLYSNSTVACINNLALHPMFTDAYQPDSDDDDSYQKTTATADEVDDDTLNELDSTLLRSIDSANAENSLNSITSNGRNRSFLLHDPYLHPIEKLWCILIQIDFNLGHLLGNKMPYILCLLQRRLTLTTFIQFIICICRQCICKRI